jgi:hypothetical protein
MIHFVQKLLVFQWCERVNPFWLKQPLFRPFNFLIFKSIEVNGPKAYPRPVLIHEPERPAGKFLIIAYVEGISQTTFCWKLKRRGATVVNFMQLEPYQIADYTAQPFGTVERLICRVV